MLVIEINIKIWHQITNFFMSKIITKARKQIYINIYLKCKKLFRYQSAIKMKNSYPQNITKSKKNSKKFKKSIDKEK